MKCAQCKSQLVDFVESLLPPEDRLRVEEHIRRCPACRNELSRLQNTLAIMEGDVMPKLAPAKKQAIMPLVMERVTQITARRRRRNKYAYGFASALLLFALFTVAVIGFRNRSQTDYYELFFDPAHLIYSDDSAVNDYVLQSLLDDGTLIAEVREAADDAWIHNSALTSLVDELSEDEIGTLIEKLETFDLNGG